MRPHLRISILTMTVVGMIASPALSAPHRAGAHPTTVMHPKVSVAAARAIAQAKVPRGRVKSHELERESGRLIYSFDFAVPGRTGIDEVNVDATTGAVLAVVHESPQDERREALADRKEASRRTRGR